MINNLEAKNLNNANGLVKRFNLEDRSTWSPSSMGRCAEKGEWCTTHAECCNNQCGFFDCPRHMSEAYIPSGRCGYCKRGLLLLY